MMPDKQRKAAFTLHASLLCAPDVVGGGGRAGGGSGVGQLGLGWVGGGGGVGDCVMGQFVSLPGLKESAAGPASIWGQALSPPCQPGHLPLPPWLIRVG